MSRILVIDDDEAVNHMIRQLLTAAGHEVEDAPDGARGMRLLERGSFDLVVTDILMPEREGLETIRQIREKSKTLPVIAISGGGRMAPEQCLAMAQCFGADYTFQKPFDHEAFLGAVRECLDGV